jgi:hypothetical protein
MKKLALFIPLALAACATVDYTDEGIQRRIDLAEKECRMMGYSWDERLGCVHEGYRQITGAEIAAVQSRNNAGVGVANTAIAIGAAGGL